MIHGEIRHQRLTLTDTHAVADTIDYLEMSFAFTSDWDGCEKWAHFSDGERVYDIPLTDDRIRKEDHLNLAAGKWTVWLHGNRFAGGGVAERITTDVARLYVAPTGMLDGEPLPEVPATQEELLRAEMAELRGDAERLAGESAASAGRAEEAAGAAKEAKEGAAASETAAGKSAAEAAESARRAAVSETNAETSEANAAASEASARENAEIALAAGSTAAETLADAKAFDAEIKANRDDVAANTAETLSARDIAVRSSEDAVAANTAAQAAKKEAVAARDASAINAQAAENAKNSMVYVSFTMDEDGNLIVKHPEILGTTDFRLNNGDLEVRI